MQLGWHTAGTQLGTQMCLVAEDVEWENTHINGTGPWGRTRKCIHAQHVKDGGSSLLYPATVTCPLRDLTETRLVFYHNKGSWQSQLLIFHV